MPPEQSGGCTAPVPPRQVPMNCRMPDQFVRGEHRPDSLLHKVVVGGATFLHIQLHLMRRVCSVLCAKRSRRDLFLCLGGGFSGGGLCLRFLPWLRILVSSAFFADGLADGFGLGPDFGLAAGFATGFADGFGFASDFGLATGFATGLARLTLPPASTRLLQRHRLQPAGAGHEARRGTSLPRGRACLSISRTAARPGGRTSQCR